MKYIIQQEELEEIKSASRSEGYKDAELLLDKILRGQTNIFTAAERDFVGNVIRTRPVGNESVWGRLLSRLCQPTTEEK